MAITFDNQEVISQIYYFDASANTYTNRSSSATTDLFANDATVGDMLYFSQSSHWWHNLVFTISTPITATGLTIVWEYYTDVAPAGWKTLTVTDGTNNFTQNGTISFDVPDAWTRVRLNNTWFGIWVRARITACASLTEGGAKSGNVYNNDYGIYVTGANNRLSAIKTANDAGNWGVVQQLGNHYKIISNLYIGDGVNADSLLVINNEYLEVGHQDSPYTQALLATTKYRVIGLRSYATLQIGNTSSGECYEGSMVKWWTYDTGNYNTWGLLSNLKMYNSIFVKSGGGYAQPAFSSTMDIQNSVLQTLDGTTWYFQSNTSGSLKNLTVELGTNTALYMYSTNMAISNLIFGRTNGVLLGATGGLLQDTDFGTTKKMQAGNNGVACTAKNCTFSSLTTQLALAASCTINLVYTTNIIATDEKGNTIATPRVKIVNSQGTELFNGDWTQALDITAYQAVTNATSIRTNTNFCPLEIWVSKDGYETSYQKLNLTNSNKNILVKLRQGTPGRDSMGVEWR